MLRVVSVSSPWFVVVLASSLSGRVASGQDGKAPSTDNGSFEEKEVYRAKQYGHGEVLFEGDYDSTTEFIKEYDRSHPTDLRLLMLKGPYKVRVEHLKQHKSPPPSGSNAGNPFVADMNKVMKWKGTCVGEGKYKGECVSLVRAATGLRETRFWKPGAKVAGSTSLVKGTPIATFDDHGHYPTGSDKKKHAAIFDHVDERGVIWVWHQYAKGKRPNEVHLAPLTSGGADTDQYYVIDVASP